MYVLKEKGGVKIFKSRKRQKTPEMRKVGVR